MMNKNQAIKKLSEEFVVLKEAEKTVFSRIVNKLLQVNLITRKKIADANDYRIVLAYKEIFETYFCLSNFELIIEWHGEVLYIKNILNLNQIKNRKAESVL